MMNATRTREAPVLFPTSHFPFPISHFPMPCRAMPCHAMPSKRRTQGRKHISHCACTLISASRCPGIPVSQDPSKDRQRSAVRQCGRRDRPMSKRQKARIKSHSQASHPRCTARCIAALLPSHRPTIIPTRVCVRSGKRSRDADLTGVLDISSATETGRLFCCAQQSFLPSFTHPLNPYTAFNPYSLTLYIAE